MRKHFTTTRLSARISYTNNTHTQTQHRKNVALLLILSYSHDKHSFLHTLILTYSCSSVRCLLSETMKASNTNTNTNQNKPPPNNLNTL